MSSNKVKFSVSIKEISFTFEGDYELGKRMQSGINNAMGEIAALQGSALGIEGPHDKKTIEASAVVTPAAPKRRRRRSVAVDDASKSEGNGDNSPPEKKSSGSPTALLKTLRKDGFMDTGKTAGQILAELSRLGHTNMTSSSLTAPLQNLCKSSILSRTKDSNLDVWVYARGPKDE